MAFVCNHLNRLLTLDCMTLKYAVTDRQALHMLLKNAKILYFYKIPIACKLFQIILHAWSQILLATFKRHKVDSRLIFNFKLPICCPPPLPQRKIFLYQINFYIAWTQHLVFHCKHTYNIIINERIKELGLILYLDRYIIFVYFFYGWK